MSASDVTDPTPRPSLPGATPPVRLTPCTAGGGAAAAGAGERTPQDVRILQPDRRLLHRHEGPPRAAGVGPGASRSHHCAAPSASRPLLWSRNPPVAFTPPVPGGTRSGQGALLRPRGAHGGEKSAVSIPGRPVAPEPHAIPHLAGFDWSEGPRRHRSTGARRPRSPTSRCALSQSPPSLLVQPLPLACATVHPSIPCIGTSDGGVPQVPSGQDPYRDKGKCTIL